MPWDCRTPAASCSWGLFSWVLLEAVILNDFGALLPGNDVQQFWKQNKPKGTSLSKHHPKRPKGTSLRNRRQNRPKGTSLKLQPTKGYIAEESPSKTTKGTSLRKRCIGLSLNAKGYSDKAAKISCARDRPKTLFFDTIFRRKLQGKSRHAFSEGGGRRIRKTDQKVHR